MIPEKFKIAGGREIKVEIVDELPQKFGEFNDIKCIIKLAKSIIADNVKYTISQEDIERTYLHELYHVIQFFSGKDFNEQEAQVFSNFMYEYLKTKE